MIRLILAVVMFATSATLSYSHIHSQPLPADAPWRTKPDQTRKGSCQQIDDGINRDQSIADTIVQSL